jgi:hypothetical protein
MWWLNSVELVFMVASVGACCGGFVALVCSNMRMSRCKKIKCCCFECDRENLSEKEYAQEITNQQHIEGSLERSSRQSQTEEIDV